MLAEEMKKTFAIAAMLLASLLVFARVNSAQATGWSSHISRGYALTTNWRGQDVPIGQSVVATAATTDSVVKKVQFRWLDPDGNPFWDENVTVSAVPLITPAVPPNVPWEVIDWATNNPGVTYWWAQSTHTPLVLGDWGLKAVFHDTTKLKGHRYVTFVIVHTSFNVLPEVPFGTMVILLSMFGALGVFATKRKRSFLNGPPS